MKAHLLIFAAVHLIPCWTKPAGKPKTPNSIPLSMVPDAVDDMYHGCTKEMDRKVKKVYFNKENVGTFKIAWENAEECSNKRRPSKALTKNQRQAICVYTSNDIYAEFNNAVRTGRNIYSSSFKFHSLHFWLTSAIQTLNSKHRCQTTYRRNNFAYTGKVNDIIRFGIFASSSFRTNLYDFGKKSCFKIKTCSGAYVKQYSEIPDEEEVLIPPYETFKITEIIEGRGKPAGLSDCEVVFILESAGGKSNLNCKAALRRESFLQLMQKNAIK